MSSAPKIIPGWREKTDPKPVRQSRAVGPGRLAAGEDEEQPGDAPGRADLLLPDQGVRRGRQLGGRALLPHRDEERRPSVSVAGACAPLPVLGVLSRCSSYPILCFAIPSRPTGLVYSCRLVSSPHARWPFPVCNVPPEPPRLIPVESPSPSISCGTVLACWWQGTPRVCSCHAPARRGCLVCSCS